MDEEYMETQETGNDLTHSDVIDNLEAAKEIAEVLGYDESYEEDDGTNSFRAGRGRETQFRYTSIMTLPNCIIRAVNMCS